MATNGRFSIYLDTAAPRRVMQTFHYALNPEGFLMLGPSESVGQTTDLFELTDKHHRIYTRKTTPPGTRVDLMQRGGAPYNRPREAVESEPPPRLLQAHSAQHEADRFKPAEIDELKQLLASGRQEPDN
jgi:two-component system, chemotaxis family, CheB/CheR fusion protein